MPSPKLTLESLMSLQHVRKWLVPALVSFAACQGDGDRGATMVAPRDRVLAAKGGTGGGPTPLSVTSTNPPQATQDTTLNVTIAGSGFTIGAKATWALNGDTTLVHVKSTKFVSSTQLVAQVFVPAGAPVASYDVQVTLSDGKKGVGAELFVVTQKDPTAQLLFPLDDAGLGVTSDRLYAAGDASVYAEGSCGVHAKIFATTQLSNTGDVVMQTDNKQYTDRHCTDYPRKVIVNYGDGTAPQASVVFINVRDVQRDNDPADQIAIGDQRIRGLHVNEARCGGLVWQAALGDGTSTNGADSVIVTRTAANSWLVTTQPAPNDKAYCKVDGHLYHIPIKFTVVRNAP